MEPSLDSCSPSARKLPPAYRTPEAGARILIPGALRSLGGLRRSRWRSSPMRRDEKQEKAEEPPSAGPGHPSTRHGLSVLLGGLG